MFSPLLWQQYRWVRETNDEVIFHTFTADAVTALWICRAELLKGLSKVLCFFCLFLKPI